MGARVELLEISGWFTKIKYYNRMVFKERALAPSECLIIVVF
jgi:hypothetical protein